jgi:hypothetical protein
MIRIPLISDEISTPSLRFSVVIATYNRKRLLAHLRTPDNFVIVTQSNNVGHAAYNNTGASSAGGGVLLFVDDDMQCSSLAVHLAVAKRSLYESIAVSGDFPSIVLKESLDEKFDRYQQLYLLWPDDASLMPHSSLPSSLFLSHGGFDEINFVRRREDEEFGLRLWKGSVPFIFEPSAFAWHFWEKASVQMKSDWKEEGGICRWLAFGLIQVVLSASRTSGESAQPICHKLFSVQRAFFAFGGASNGAGTWQEFRQFGSCRVDSLDVLQS